MRRAGLLLALLLAAPAALAVDAAGLVAAGRLQLRTDVEPAGTVVPGQKARVLITVATDGWFAGGTRIRVPEVPGLILLQTEQFATNSSEYRDGNTWVVQRWTVDAYATGAGDFPTGPIDLDVQVNSGDGIAAGRVQAPPVTIRAAVPPGLDAAQWVASPAFRASQRLDPQVEALRPGDAVTRTITLEAADVLDKMLPPVAAAAQPGLAAYPRPPRLETASNRGESLARRVEEVTYVAERPGEYTLPAYRFAWWNTGAGQLRWVELEAVPLRVSGAPAREPSIAQRLRRHLPLLAAVLGVLLAVAAAWRWLPRAGLVVAVRGCSRRLAAAWRRLRAPALPARLNPWRERDPGR